ncbi:RICIN domain-containing protein [Isoptericola sp. NPDC060257]|uniref:RICIN domain-containing protein n=1 Tax=Isoptericola sp. NPDC060257 TaxID=3347087 RepID=UPI0036536D84
MKNGRERGGLPALTAAAAAAALGASLLAGAGTATAADAPPEIPVAADGSVAADPAYEGPQVTEVRVINEGKFLEISWDRYVDETAAVSPENVTLTQGGTTVALTAKPATGPTDTIFFDKDNRQIAASDANSMARLPDDLHLASIAYTGTLDPDEPLTVTVDGSQIEDAEGRPARDATYTGVPRLDYYTQSVTTASGIVVKANPRVDPATLDLAAAQVDVQLGKADNGIAARMADFGCSLAVYAARENAYLVPEHRGGYDPEMYDVEGYGGSEWNGCVSSISERNVLRTRGDENAFLNTGYPNENILVHEFGHAVRLVGIETLADKGLSDELYAAYENSWTTGRWPNTYAIGNIDEYFATLSAIWFDVMAEKPDWTDGVRSPINTRAELKAYDPQAYALFAKVYPADLTLPAPWDEPAPDVYHGDFTQVPDAPERVTAEDVDFATDAFRIVTDGIGTEYQVDRYAGDADHPERDVVVWSWWGDGVWSLAPVGGGAYTIAASDGSGALAAVSDTEVRYAGVEADAGDPRQRWTFAPDASTAQEHDGHLVNAATGGALDVDGRTTSGVSLTLTDPADATRWLLEDTTRTSAQGVGAYLLPDVTAPEVTSAWAHPNRKSLTLDATDDASGVALVEYRVGRGDWAAYRGAIAIGPRDRVEARATDRAGNVSEVLVVTRR